MTAIEPWTPTPQQSAPLHSLSKSVVLLIIRALLLNPRTNIRRRWRRRGLGAPVFFCQPAPLEGAEVSRPAVLLALSPWVYVIYAVISSIQTDVGTVICASGVPQGKVTKVPFIVWTAFPEGYSPRGGGGEQLGKG